MDDLIRRHGPRLNATVARILGDAAGADDVCQETWFQVWRRRGEIRAPDPWPFIRRVGLSRALDRMRRGERVRPLAPEELPGPRRERAGADEDRLLRGLDGLHREERAALVLFFWEGLSVREIAEALEALPGTVKTWMRRGREKLRAALEDDDEL